MLQGVIGMSGQIIDCIVPVRVYLAEYVSKIVSCDFYPMTSFKKNCRPERNRSIKMNLTGIAVLSGTSGSSSYDDIVRQISVGKIHVEIVVISPTTRRRAARREATTTGWCRDCV